MRVATDELVALLCPNAAVASEYPSRPLCFVVARSAHNGGVAVGGQGDGRTLGPQATSIFAGGTDQFIALLRPNAVAVREHPRRSSRADRRRPTEIRVVGARSPHDGSA